MPQEPEREPLIDRTLEVQLLRQHLDGVVQGDAGHAVLLLGESGVGKSRLAAVALDIADTMGMRSLAARCLGPGAEPLLPLKEALAGYLGRTPERIRRTLVGASPRLLESVPFVGAFLASVGSGLSDRRAFESAGLHGVYEELAHVLLGIAERDGLCVVVEDLHAADQDTLYFLQYLLRKVRQHRIAVVLTAQEEQLGQLPQLADLVVQWTVEGCAVLTVLPLERAHVGEYVHQVAALGQPVDEHVVDELFRLTGGNPFFLRETLRLLADAEHGQDTDPKVPGPASSPGGEVTAAPSGPEPGPQIQMPAGAEAVLQRRLSRAQRSTRRFLDAAAVVLETANELAPIASVAEFDMPAALEALEEACELRIMREGSDGDVAFTHDLMRRAVYGRIGANQRYYLHERAARWFEQAQRPGLALFHYRRAGRPEGLEDFDGALVRTALAAAAQAERAGMYHSALTFYQQVRRLVPVTELGPRLTRALIVLGDWPQAQELVDALPADDGRVRLLRSELRFVQGDFQGARDEAQAALASHSVDRFDVLMRLANIGLYLGDFAETDEWGRQALTEAERTDDPNRRARCGWLLGATALFSGRVDEAHDRFTAALELLVAQPEADQDRITYTTLVGYLGLVAESRDDWSLAAGQHAEALRLRREMADARGVLHSMHRLGRARLRLGETDAGLALLDEAEQLADDLDEPLERAKLTHMRATLQLEAGDCAEAGRLAAAALEVFERCSTRYDIAHAGLTLSQAALACGDEQSAVEHGARARAAIERWGYGLLRLQFPDVAFAWSDRIAGAVTAYACGDALGVPWEGQAPLATAPPSGSTVRAEDAERIEDLPAREHRPRGSVSDDTVFTLLVAHHLAERAGQADPQVLLAALADELQQAGENAPPPTHNTASGEPDVPLPSDTGFPGEPDESSDLSAEVESPGEPAFRPVLDIGPSTRAAVEGFTETGSLPTSGGRTNGAAMRALPVGWAVPIEEPERRRRLAIELSRATHPHPDAQSAACVVAACGAWALDGAPPRLLAQVAREEHSASAEMLGADSELGELLTAVVAGTWRAPADGITLDPCETVAAVIDCVLRASSLRDGLLRAVSLGGDTDTVAALTGGLLGAQHTPDQVRSELPWFDVVHLPGAAVLAEVGTALTHLRAGT